MRVEHDPSVLTGLTISIISVILAVCGVFVVLEESWLWLLGAVCLAWSGFGLAMGVWEFVRAVTRNGM